MLKQSLTKARVHKLQPPLSPGFFAVSTASCRPHVKACSQLDCLIACIYTDYRQVTHTTALENWNMSWVSLLYKRSFVLPLQAGLHIRSCALPLQAGLHIRNCKICIIEVACITRWTTCKCNWQSWNTGHAQQLAVQPECVAFSL